MSKERDLLKQVVENFAYVQDMHLIVAIQKLLAQPEQVQEPVAWKGRAYGNLHHVDYGNSIPLYTAPPKREPFGPEERERLSRAYSTKAEQVAFEEGIIFAEISYGIGGGE
jgi:hypothetical protein